MGIISGSDGGTIVFGNRKIKSDEKNEGLFTHKVKTHLDQSSSVERI